MRGWALARFTTRESRRARPQRDCWSVSLETDRQMALDPGRRAASAHLFECGSAGDVERVDATEARGTEAILRQPRGLDHPVVRQV